MNGDHDAFRDAAAAWVLGALDEDEAWRFVAHLEVCAVCRAEVARLQVAADALPLAAPPVDPPPELRERLLAIVEAEARERGGAAAVTPLRSPRRRLALPRPLLAAAAAVALVVLGGVAGFALRGHGPRAPVAQTVQASLDPARAGRASAQLVEVGGNAVLRVARMPAPPPGRVYQAWVQRPGVRAPEPDAVFTVDARGRGSVALTHDVRGATAVQVTEEPEGGSPTPTHPPILVARPA